MNSHELGLADN